MFDLLQGKKKEGKVKEGTVVVSKNVSKKRFDFQSSSYTFPTLYEEADEMMIVALLMYTITELRAMAKAEKISGDILKLPITLEKTLRVIQEHASILTREMADHEMTLTALQSIQARVAQSKTEGSPKDGSHSWWNPFVFNNNQHNNTAGTHANEDPAVLTAFGDEAADKELVYAVGMDHSRKRITVAFRGSVTPADFFTDACIELNRRPNPVQIFGDNDGEKKDDSGRIDPNLIGIHHGFDEYLLKRRKNKPDQPTKFDEIMNHVLQLFQGRTETYKLYVTGHSLGGALACLFSFEAAAAAQVPFPVTCVSVASPRVGDPAFQNAFARLEEAGRLRHLRIAHAQDPVTMMPKASSRKILAMMSPITFIVLSLKDAFFASSETYRHTGVKLRLMSLGQSQKVEDNSDDNKVAKQYSISYRGATTVQEEVADDTNQEAASLTQPSNFIEKTLAKLSLRSIPGVAFHYAPTYMDQLAKCKEDLMDMQLNDMYAKMG